MRVLSRIGVCLIAAGISASAAADIVVDGYVLGLENVSNYNVNVVNGNLEITINTTDGNWTLLPSDVVPDPDPITLTFSGNPTTVNEGASVTFSWTSSNASTCTTSGGNAAWAALGSVALSGSAIITMDTLNPPAFQLTCTGAGLNPVARAVNVTVNEVFVDPNPTNCPAPETSSGEVVSWSDYWGGQTWPSQDVVQKDDRIGRFDYLAIEFNTANFNGFGLVKTIQLSDGNRNVAISKCPGVFVEAVPAACFQRQANGQSLFWSTDGSRACQLDNNTTYYVNITYVDVANQSSSSTFCGSSSCRFYINGGAAATN